MAIKKPLTLKAGTGSVNVDDYTIMAFQSLEDRGEFERLFIPSNKDLINLLKNQDQITITMYDDEARTVPALEISGTFRYFVTQNPEHGMVERIALKGKVTYP